MDKKINSENRDGFRAETQGSRKNGEIPSVQDCREICDGQSTQHRGEGLIPLEAEGWEMENSCQCSHRTKERSPKEYRDLLNRLNRIEGQVRGIRGMLERDAYCADILVQVSAVNAALNSFNKVLLSNHIHTCVAEDIRKGNDEAIDELTDLLKKLMK